MFEKALKGLKDLVVEDDSKTKKAVPVAAAPVVVPATGSSSTLVSPSTGEPGTTALDVPGITTSIEKDIRGSAEYAIFNKFEGVVESLKSVPSMDEATRFRAAQATLGASTEDLLAALESHGTVLANAASRFEAEFVASTKRDIDELHVMVEQAEQKVQDLTQQLGAASQEKAALVTTAQQKTIDLSKADIDFKGIVTNLSTKYHDITNKVQQYLGVANAK